MKIGIISKKAHAKSHARKLRKAGQDVELLGGDPQELPDSLDLLICRTVSCSHQAAAVAQEAKRNGFPVLFEDSVTRMVAAVERFAEEGDLDGKVDKNDTSPVRGICHRAYYDKKSDSWSIRSGPPWKTHITSVTTRVDVIEAIKVLDEKAMAKAEPEPEPEPATGNIDAVLGLLLEEMQKLGVFEYEHEGMGLSVRLQQVHLASPKGSACGHGSRSSTNLSQVTCKTCRSSSFFETAQWVLENMGEERTPPRG